MKNTFLVLDTETADLSGNVYDIGYVICNKRGEIVCERNWLVEEALPQLLAWRDGGAPTWMVAPEGAKLAAALDHDDDEALLAEIRRRIADIMRLFSRHIETTV